MILKKKYGDLALIAGASEGIGAAFSEYLAKSGFDLILLARTKEPLEKFASSIIERYKVRVRTICCDLSEVGAVNYLTAEMEGASVDVLVYNAALSFIGPFEDDTAEHMNRIAAANMITPLNLVRIYGEDMLRRGKGAIVLMSSLAGLQGSGFLASYAATKAFGRILAESLWYEWKGKGVDVLACCAGATSTPKYLATKPGTSGFLAPRVTTPGEVVEECFRQLGKRPSFVAGRGNRTAAFFMMRMMPRKMAIRIMGDTTRKIYKI